MSPSDKSIHGPPKTKQPHAWQGTGLSSDNNGVCQNAFITNPATKEAAIIVLRAGVEALYRLEERKRPLFEIAEGLDTTIYRVFERREYRARRERVPERRRVDACDLGGRLSRASRLRVAAEMDRLIDAAEAAGLGEEAIRDELYAPLMAAEEKEEARKRRRNESAARLVAAWNTAILEASANDASPEATLAAAVSAARGFRREKGGSRG
jgi:hypothetical protein